MVRLASGPYIGQEASQLTCTLGHAGVTYTTPDPGTLMNHGGYSTDDTHIACLIAVNGGTQVTVNETVYHTQARVASDCNSRISCSERHTACS